MENINLSQEGMPNASHVSETRAADLWKTGVSRDDSDGAKVSENPHVAGRSGSNLGQMVGTLEIGDF